MGTAAARQRRWQARNLVKLTAPADDIATKLIGMADRNKLRDIYIALDEYLEPIYQAEFNAEFSAKIRGLDAKAEFTAPMRAFYGEAEVDWHCFMAEEAAAGAGILG